MSNTGFSGNFFEPHIRRSVGQKVTVFTTSGGESGSGFNGVLLQVDCDFIRLTSQQGTGPTNPFRNNNDECNNGRNHKNHCNQIGTEVDIPIDRIASFVHRAI
jgi:hypothetical protein